MRGVKRMEDLQQLAMPEIAFCGRSNVGKSSLLNAILGQKSLARISKTPGRTRELNFFNLGDRLILVDMPGYGYARVPESERRNWDKFFPEYLSTRDRLLRVFLLIDARHGIKHSDNQMMDLLDQTETAYQLVFTKSDEILHQDFSALKESAENLQQAHQQIKFPAHFVSSHKKTGIVELQAEILNIMGE